jgi:hypothetical protein
VVEPGQKLRHILYDLADLVPIEDADLVSTEDGNALFVKVHLDILKGRMGEQENVGEQYECQKVLEEPIFS